jgi:large subunit ribosomal protein L15
MPFSSDAPGGAQASQTEHMMTKLNTIKDNPGSSKKRMRVGRGIGSGKGKTGGRGVKGQKARTGVAIKGFEGGQMPLHRRLPKRGFVNVFRVELNELNLDRLQTAIDAKKIDLKNTITNDALVEAGVLSKKRQGLKLLGKGKITAKANFEVAAASKSAIEAIEKAGGSVKVVPVKKPVEVAEKA